MLKLSPRESLPAPKRRAFAHVPQLIWAGQTTKIFRIDSSENEKIYEVTVVQVGEDTYLHCSCPHGIWAEQRGDSCKHLRAVMEVRDRMATAEEQRIGLVV